MTSQYKKIKWLIAKVNENGLVQYFYRAVDDEFIGRDLYYRGERITPCSPSKVRYYLDKYDDSEYLHFN